jgi:arsenate reductase
MNLTIWHNNLCSTSRKALDYLENLGYKITIRPYLTEPPSETELEEVLKKLGENATYILRKKDKVFLEKFADINLSSKEWIKAMHNNPSMIERPIVISDKKAWLARPFDKWVEEFEV